MAPTPRSLCASTPAFTAGEAHRRCFDSPIDPTPRADPARPPHRPPPLRSLLRRPQQKTRPLSRVLHPRARRTRCHIRHTTATRTCPKERGAAPRANSRRAADRLNCVDACCAVPHVFRGVALAVLHRNALSLKLEACLPPSARYAPTAGATTSHNHRRLCWGAGWHL
jgi:hypothetical protein